MSNNRVETDEVLQSDLLQAQRELLRWKLLARQREERLKEIESSIPWRIYAALAHLYAALKYRWKALLLLILIGLLLLPLLPLLVIMLLLPAGRHQLWQMSEKLGPAGDLLQEILSRLRAGKVPTASETGELRPRVHQRPPQGKDIGAPRDDEQARQGALQQLAPQRRSLLQKIQPDSSQLVDDAEAPEHLSLSRSEASLLKVVTAKIDDQD